jgi:hypothetical protein
MNTRDNAVVAELEAQRSMLASRAAIHAGKIAELEAALAASKAETEAQRLRADEAEAKLRGADPASGGTHVEAAPLIFGEGSVPVVDGVLVGRSLDLP